MGVGEADSHGRLRRHPAVEGVHADALTVCDVDHLDPARQYKILQYLNMHLAGILKYYFGSPNLTVPGLISHVSR